MLVSQSQLSCWGEKGGGIPPEHSFTTPSLVTICRGCSDPEVRGLDPSTASVTGNPREQQGQSFQSGEGGKGGSRSWVPRPLPAASQCGAPHLCSTAPVSLRWDLSLLQSQPPDPRGCAESVHLRTLGRSPQSQQMTLASDKLLLKFGRKRPLHALRDQQEAGCKWKAVSCANKPFVSIWKQCSS